MHCAIVRFTPCDRACQAAVCDNVVQPVPRSVCRARIAEQSTHADAGSAR